MTYKLLSLYESIYGLLSIVTWYMYYTVGLNVSATTSLDGLDPDALSPQEYFTYSTLFSDSTLRVQTEYNVLYWAHESTRHFQQSTWRI